jgi:NADPH-dependent ferric siderophore reductase
MTAQTAPVQAPPVLVAEARVRRTERISPAFMRVVLESPAFVDLAPDEGYDTRFKVVFPGPTGLLPPIPQAAEDYYPTLLAMPDEVRAPMRTYTIREVLTEGADVLLVADFVVHEPFDEAGPACRWAMTAQPGDVVHVIAPHRRSAEDGVAYGGTEFDPGDRRRLLVAGDETTVPAVARILADLPDGYTGRVFVEVPSAADVLHLPMREGFEVVWLNRDGERYGRALVEAVRRYLGLPQLDADGLVLPEAPATLDIDVWETPRYSASGEDVEAQLQRRTIGAGLDDLYAWIAGESWAVKVLRRSLVRDLGVDRAQVAFMGYWREGVAMRS